MSLNYAVKDAKAGNFSNPISNDLGIPKILFDIIGNVTPASPTVTIFLIWGA